MDVAIIGAAGACGRQLAVQLLVSAALQHSTRLQLVGHHGGSSENELWGMRSDLEDSFVDVAPPIEVVQSNPVELGVQVMAEAVGRHRVIGAGACPDTLRFRRSRTPPPRTRLDAAPIDVPVRPCAEVTRRR